jgi:sec-independent protein translocase protein TatA
MPTVSGLPSPVYAQPWEWIILLIIVALLLLFGPSKLPEFARSIGRAMGEFRRGKAQVERELRDELTRDEVGESGAGRDQVLRAAKELAVPTEARDMKDIRLDIAKGIDRVETPRVVSIAKIFGLPVEGVSPQTLKEQIIRRLQI